MAKPIMKKRDFHNCISITCLNHATKNVRLGLYYKYQSKTLMIQIFV